MAQSATANDDIALIEALRTRGLDRLAELRCNERLADSNLSPREAVAFAVQRSLIEIDRAAAAAQSNRAMHWKLADEAPSCEN